MNSHIACFYAFVDIGPVIWGLHGFHLSSREGSLGLSSKKSSAVGVLHRLSFWRPECNMDILTVYEATNSGLIGTDYLGH